MSNSKMQAISHEATEMPINELEYMSNDDLAVALKKIIGFIGISAHAVALAARIWAEMERRGLDMSHYRKGLQFYLPLVVRGKLLPEMVEEVEGDADVLRPIAALTRDRQKELLQAGCLPVYDSKRQEIMMVPLEKLKAEQADLAIDEKLGALRSAEEQKLKTSSLVVIEPSKRQRVAQTMHLVVERSVGSRVQLAASSEFMTVSEYLLKHLPLAAPASKTPR